MDTLAIARALRRHWRWTIPIVVLILAVAVYILVATPTTYEATASYVLFPPPAAPTSDQIKENPALGLVHADNPYARMDQSVVVSIIAKRVNDGTMRSELVAKGADAGYKVTTGGLYGIASPTADVKGTGDSAKEAINTAKIVGAEFERNLHDIQAVQGTDDAYKVKAVVVDPPTSASEKASSRTRSVVAVLGLGALLLFVAVSIGEALENAKKERMARRSKFVLPYALDHPSKHSGGNGRSTEPAEPSTSGAFAALAPPDASPTPSTNGGRGTTARWR